MSFKFRSKLSLLLTNLRFIPACYILVPAVLLVAALVIRLATGGTHLVYNVLDGRGIFPGPFMYLVFYSIRIILCGIALSFVLFSRRVYEERFRLALLLVTATVLLLLEYRLIFGGVSLVLAMTFCLVVMLCCALALLSARFKTKAFVVSSILLMIGQLFFFIQLISLAICI